MKILVNVTIALFIFIFSDNVFSQVELVPVTNPVYDYLKKMQLEGNIEDYNSANIPVSRKEVAGYLKLIQTHSEKLSKIDKQFLNDYNIEFEYDISGETKNQRSLFSQFNGENIISDKYQKYLYYYTDTNSAFFLDGIGNISHRESNGDSISINSITLGESGFRLRGTLFNSLGFYLRASNGQKLSGKDKDVSFAANTDPKLQSSEKWVNERKNFDSYEGYLRYQTNSNWFGLTVGREAVNQGFGYIDKMFLSNNAVPFDMIKVDLKYKIFKYSFIYGSIKGDSLGVEMPWKSIATHRLDLNFSRVFKMGFTETLIISTAPFSLNYLNPFGFIVSGDLNTGGKNTYQNNAIMGVDIEINPVKNIAMQGTLLIDDLNLATITKYDYSSNENKFGFQAGGIWTDAFNLPNLTFALEYTRLNPFVYAHRSNKNQYTNWGLSLGHALPPNSDEVAAKLKVDITSRIILNLLYQYQRSGDGFEYDQFGNVIINYGGTINRGDFDFKINNVFLNGHRINRSIFTFNLLYQPLRQYYLAIKYQYKLSDSKYLGKNFKDSFFFLTLGIDY